MNGQNQVMQKILDGGIGTMCIVHSGTDVMAPMESMRFVESQMRRTERFGFCDGYERTFE
jgi:hypothetical protein